MFTVGGLPTWSRHKLVQAARSLQKQLLGYETEVLTFSQAGEDLIIRNYFYSRLCQGDSGFYVDIGAFHPYRHSNSYYLYRCGWRGINIDARPGSMRLFEQLRPRDINLEIALGRDEGIADYYDLGDRPGLNSFSRDYLETLGNTSAIRSVVKIQTRRLKDVLGEHVARNQEIDFLSIDIEGLDEAVLASNDWERFRPKLVAAEVYGQSVADILNATISRQLLEQEYEFYTRVILAIPNVNTVFFVDSRKGNVSNR